MYARPCAIALSLAALVAAGAADPGDEPPAARPRAEVADLLKKAMEEADGQGGADRQVEILRRAAEEAVHARPQNLLMAEALHGAAGATEPDSGRLAGRWRAAVAEAVEVLEFEVQEESPLPDGFPKPPPLGEISIQTYPAYRAARAEMGDGDNGAFMRLFGHITSKGIAMTAPVEMNYAPADGGKPRKVDMKFLYRNTGQGTLGGDRVKVQDAGALTAVSLGLRGAASESRVEEARQKLEAWLASHAKEYRAAGPLRTLNYNSPFLAAKKQFFEVQIPIEPAASTP